MSKKNIEKYIKPVLEILDNDFKDNPIPSEFNGYISSFGASIIQSGLKPTIALFENKNSNTKGDKSYLTEVISKVLKTGDQPLLRYVIAHENDPLLKQKILDISVAIKLSIRTFQFDKGENYE